MNDIEWLEEQVDKEVRASTRKIMGVNYTTLEFLLNFYGMSPKSEHWRSFQCVARIWHPIGGRYRAERDKC